MSDETTENTEVVETESSAPAETDASTADSSTEAASSDDSGAEIPKVEAKAKKASPGKGEVVVDSAVSGETEGAAPYAPNLKFKVLDKEHEIDKRFHALMKDADSEKAVRELHEKAFGLDVVKPKLAEVRQERDKIFDENTKIKAGIDGLRSIVQKAVSSGNYLKMDDFFSRLNIPTDLVMQYALEKVKLAEMPQEQRHLIEAKLEAERTSEKVQADSELNAQYYAQQAAQIKSMQFQVELQKPEVQTIEQSFDTRFGKAGAFKEQVIRHGELAWHQSKGAVNLTPAEAIEQVIQTYNLRTQTAAGAATQAGAQNGNGSGKKVIVRTDKTIPNVQGRSTSPLATKPKSLDDLKALYKQKVAEG